jgi:hypothetical protein
MPKYVGTTISRQGEKVISLLSFCIMCCFVAIWVIYNVFLSRIYYGTVFIRDGNTYFSFLWICFQRDQLSLRKWDLSALILDDP